MNKRITAKIAKRRANSPKAKELRRWLLELATAKQQYEALKIGRIPPFTFSAPPNTN